MSVFVEYQDGEAAQEKREVAVTYAVVTCVFTEDVGVKFEDKTGRLLSKAWVPEGVKVGDVVRMTIDLLREL